MSIFGVARARFEKAPERPTTYQSEADERRLTVRKLCNVLSEGLGTPAPALPNANRIALSIDIQPRDDNPGYKITDTSPNSESRKFRIEELGSRVLYTLDFGARPDSNEPTDSPIFLASPLQHARLMSGIEALQTFTEDVALVLEVED